MLFARSEPLPLRPRLTSRPPKLLLMRPNLFGLRSPSTSELRHSIPEPDGVQENTSNVRFLGRLCENEEAASFLVRSPAQSPASDRFQKLRYPEDRHHPLQIVGQNVQCHLGGNVLQRFHLEVCSTHPRLDRPERVLDGLAP